MPRRGLGVLDALRIAAGMLAFAVFAGCATGGGKPSANGLLKANAEAFAGAADAYATMLARGRIGVDKAKWASAALEQPASDLLAARAVLIGCPDPCSDLRRITDGLRPSLLELERKLREEEAAAKRAQEVAARSRDAGASRSLLGVVGGINDALLLIDSVNRLRDAFTGLDTTTAAEVDTAFARLDASRKALSDAIAAY